MSASAGSAVMAAGGIFVVTQVIPAPQAAAPQNLPEIKESGRGRLEALGTTQIMISLTIFLFELTMTKPANTLGTLTGAFIWGPVCFITAGSLTVAAGKASNRSLVNVALTFNAIAATVTAPAIIVYVLDASNNFLRKEREAQQILKISGVFSALCFLEFLVSISVVLVGCNEVCPSTAREPVTISNQSLEAISERTHALPGYEAPPIGLAPPPPYHVYEQTAGIDPPTIWLEDDPHYLLSHSCHHQPSMTVSSSSLRPLTTADSALLIHY